MPQHESGGNCLICLNKIRIYTITGCGHTVCHLCFIRMRCIDSMNQCCKFCRAKQNVVIFSRKLKPYSSFNRQKLSSYHINDCKCFSDTELRKEMTKLLFFTCPISKCNKQFEHKEFYMFNFHLAKHKLRTCQVCFQHRTVLPGEAIIYTSDQLKIHNKKGDLSFRKNDQTGFLGHKECSRCNTRLYDDTELKKHKLRDH